MTSARSVIKGAHAMSRHPILPRKATAEGEPLPLVYQRRVRCVAGRGGDGMISFLRAYRHPFGGPDGGDGGAGGHVILRASQSVGDLSHIRSELRAGHGGYGGSKSLHGKSAPHLEVKVPLFTAVKNANSSASNSLCELNKEGQHFLAARGGIGGHGNQFYLSETMRKPFKAEVGGEGEEHLLMLTMEVIAAAGLIGFPNAGKSSLLRAISRARPKVASYPYTTLQPHVGIVHYEDEVTVSVADTPGIIEGAHLNIGLGHAFLSHIQRCSMLFFVLDASLGHAVAQRETLRKELRLHSEALAQKSSAVLLNKIDLLSEEEIRGECAGLDGAVFPVSAKTREGIIPFLVFLREQTERSHMDR